MAGNTCVLCGDPTSTSRSARCKACVKKRRCIVPDCKNKTYKDSVGNTYARCSMHHHRHYRGLPLHTRKCMRCEEHYLAPKPRKPWLCPTCEKFQDNKECGVEECSKPVRRVKRKNLSKVGFHLQPGKYCVAHDRRLWRHGSPTAKKCMWCHTIYDDPVLGYAGLCPPCRDRPGRGKRKSRAKPRLDVGGSFLELIEEVREIAKDVLKLTEDMTPPK